MGLKCGKCESEFIDGKALDQHTKAKHAAADIIQPSPKFLKRMGRKEERKAERSQELKSARTGKFLKYGVFLLIIIGVGYGLTSNPSTNPASSSVVKTNVENLAVPAVPTGPIHWHPVLTIKINDQQQTIPANIGIGPSVHQPIHTHDDTGTLHMENGNPTAENMRLGFFFNVWNKKFSKDCIFEFCSSGDKKVKFTVNGKENSDFENYSMRDGDKILIEYS